MGAALLADGVPSSWERCWEGPESAQEYCRAVVSHATAVEAWHARSCAGSLLDGALQLSQLFHPGTFLNALRQQSSRQLGQPLDELLLVTAWDAGRLAAAGARGAPLVVSLAGLCIQGALFDGSSLTAASQVGTRRSIACPPPRSHASTRHR